MNRLITTIAVSATLILTQSCSSSVQTEKTSSKTSEPNPTQMMNSGNPPTQMMDGGNPHEDHQMGDMEMSEKTAASRAKITVPPNISPNTPVSLAIDIEDSAGKAIANFDKFQEKLMHLIIVSDNLQFFSHIHPNYKGNGHFEVEATFPESGNYTLFTDYKPDGQKEQVAALKTQVPGNIPTATPLDLKQENIFENTKATLSFSEAKITAGQEIILTFNLQDAANNQPIQDLQPYLGEKGHLVIIRQTNDLRKSDYIHAHAIKDKPLDKVQFITKFPQPGKYKIWGQFNRNGKIITTDFWVNII